MLSSINNSQKLACLSAPPYSVKETQSDILLPPDAHCHHKNKTVHCNRKKERVGEPTHQNTLQHGNSLRVFGPLSFSVNLAYLIGLLQA